jgi:alanyl-tRNA synthetase
MNAIASSIKDSKKELTVDDLIRMYESDGITPDFLMEVGAIETVPSSFYAKLAELHTTQKAAQVFKPIYGLDGLLPTRLLYYEDEGIRQFSGKVLKIIDKKYVVLDQTAFYPRGGGQEPDSGEIDKVKVVDVIKQSDIVVHKLQDVTGFIEGKKVQGILNDRRRDLITKHHTATHVLNSAARSNLGSWIWQNSAFKEESYARLDITHHSALDRKEVERIEKTANYVIRQDLPVSIKIYDRGNAEQKYTFRIYQGGVVPTSNVRIVNIEGWDIEACGGTHVNNTGEIGLIKITKAERIQDGIVRLDFVAGEAAINYIQKQENQLTAIAMSLGSSKDKVVESSRRNIEDAEAAKRKIKMILRKTTPSMAKSISAEAKQLSGDGLKIYTIYDDDLDDEYYIAIGEKSIEFDPSLIYIALISKGQGIRVIVFVGEKARKKIKAGIIAKQISTQLGGSGGGNDKFGQGGGGNDDSGNDKVNDRIKEALFSVEDFVTKSIVK